MRLHLSSTSIFFQLNSNFRKHEPQAIMLSVKSLRDCCYEWYFFLWTPSLPTHIKFYFMKLFEKTFEIWAFKLSPHPPPSIHICRYNPDASLSYTFVQPRANNRSGTIQQKYRHYTQLYFYFLISCAFVYRAQHTRASEKERKERKKNSNLASKLTCEFKIFLRHLTITSQQELFFCCCRVSISFGMVIYRLLIPSFCVCLFPFYFHCLGGVYRYYSYLYRQSVKQLRNLEVAMRNY